LYISGSKIREAQAEFVLSEKQRHLIAGGVLVVDPKPPVITVVGPDRPGLLAIVAGVFALHGLNILSATARHEDSMAIEIFEVSPVFDRWPDWAKVESDLKLAESGHLDLEEGLLQRSKSYDRRPVSLPGKVEVWVDNEASQHSTVLEVRAPDGVGVLHRLAGTIASLDLDIASARVNTIGHEVVDSFYLQLPSGGKLYDPAMLAEVEEEILKQINIFNDRVYK
jgi:[protein-PII] uridylyltransferase